MPRANKEDILAIAQANAVTLLAEKLHKKRINHQVLPDGWEFSHGYGFSKKLPANQSQEVPMEVEYRVGIGTLGLTLIAYISTFRAEYENLDRKQAYSLWILDSSYPSDEDNSRVTVEENTELPVNFDDDTALILFSLAKSLQKYFAKQEKQEKTTEHPLPRNNEIV